MNVNHYNLSELLSTFYSCGWICKDMNFKSSDWNTFGYYIYPDFINIAVKLVGNNIIVRKDYDNKQLFKVDYDFKYELLNELSVPESLVLKCHNMKKKLKEAIQDFED